MKWHFVNRYKTSSPLRGQRPFAFLPRDVYKRQDKTLTAYLEDMLGQAKAKSSTAGEDVKKAKQVLTLVTCAGEIIPRTTRAAMVCTVVEAQPRAEGQSSSN